MRLRSKCLVKTPLLAVTLCSAFALNQAHAAERQSSARLAYELMLGGLHVGDAMVTLEESPSDYKAGLKMTASGALKWVKNFRASVESEGALGAAPQPAVYRKEWSSGELAETMTMTFDPATRTATTSARVFNPTTGATVPDEDVPWHEKRASRKPVPDDLRTNVFDPMAAFIAAREQLVAQGVLANAQGAVKSFRVPVFDGSRRYDIVGKTEPVRGVSINGTERQLLPVTGRLEPVFGFSAKSEERMRAVDGKIFFTPDGKFTPVQVIVSGELFTSVMNLTADCREDNAPCAAIEGAFTAPAAGEQRAQAP
jgi:hypothetical protein